MINKLNKKSFFTTDDFRLDFRSDENFDPKLLNKHCHLSYEIYLFYEGDVNYIIESSSIPMHPYYLLVLKPSAYHYAQLLSSKLYKRNVIHFDQSLLTPENNKKLLETPDIISLTPEHPLVAFLESVAVLLNSLQYNEKVELTKYVPTHITHLITTFCNEALITDNTTLPIISKVVNYLNNNFKQPLNLNNLAEEMFFNKYYICHVFKKHMGISVIEYMRQKRLLYAQSLIEKGVSATQACEEAGFSNYTTFYRSYKQFFDKIPSTQKRDDPTQ